ncbi:acetyltransferase [Variovorax paradoxus]|jgi:putative acetyltransferase|uniref:GNAT family N-acetyltransferase n=1 Tax=Variovorax TaxID=34072 RepID=UPI0006E6A316|nr:GNAT family N-acetyltransferase [Variovorax sp.]KPU88811.1 acetyltransferase [Variovorax paradoxus]KPU89141.1 acetyltransferase [Variovorax paradoxus]KPU94737.1 acetyltransferase [Variovorax paradoxus]KPV06636.1 acetyltransferase [Variovorax paradoxus]KPV16482.1 acetyltransferase [Variovorax paradoxus]
MPQAVILPAEAHHYPSLHQTLDTVAREKKYLALTEAPPYDSTTDFYRHLRATHSPHFVAVENNQVIGWCDIAPTFGQTRAHAGTLGIAMHPQARGRGLGPQLLRAAIEAAWLRGLTRIELTVRDDNLPAKALYERFGFQHEGLQRQAMRVDGIYHDVHAMALLATEATAPH